MKPTEEQLKRLMYLISCEALLDQESIGDRFMFEKENGGDFLADFLKWLENKNHELFEKFEYLDVDVAQAFWLEDDEVFRECAIYIYEHLEAMKGVIKELEGSELDRYSDWTDVDIETHGLISSFVDFEKELKELKKEYYE